MRLLQRRTDGEFSLTEVSQDIPPYAVLSHTWNHEEVTYLDVTERTGRHKKGYQKLDFCARQAASDGIPYFWVDTCCIDKSNSVELSEAINSMFRWYQQSAKCYVYLTDVSKDHDSETDEPSRSTWKLDFRKSRWFTRGWTLQELVAPASVEFFSREGQRLGDRRSLEQMVVDITHIPEAALRGGSLSDFSIGERMAWSKGRVTTREEDMAYSLFGIFGVFLPLIYGEGGESAMSRLWREISAIQDARAAVLTKLPTAYGASFDSYAEEHNPTCLPNTRVKLLHDINQWIQDPTTEGMFWLNGMAGTGKSTISRTLAHSAQLKGYLGATFFFKRGESDRDGASKFFTTITAQLASRHPAIVPHIQAAIDADPSIFHKKMQEQFQKLVLEPLSRASGVSADGSILLIVVDALDECDNNDDVKRLIGLFSSAKGLQHPRLKVFLTSRPELPIRLGFTAVQGTYQDLILHEVPELIIEHDIHAFLVHEMEQIRKQYNLPSGWPGEANIGTLVEMAVPLFIFAATVCRFTSDPKCGGPRRKLQKVLEHRTKNEGSKLNATYLPILEQLIEGLSPSDQEEALGDFRRVVGSIVVLADPLSTSALAGLLDSAPEDVSENLNLLHSVLSVPLRAEVPIKLLHLSFRDFLLDPTTTGNMFSVNETDTHKRLATDCLRLLHKSLRMDICGVQAPGTLFTEVTPKQIGDALRPEIQYACRFWVHHIVQSKASLSDSSEVYSFLTAHFLHWLEALSWIRRASESLGMLDALRDLIDTNVGSRLLAFLYDARRFASSTIFRVELAPLQVYSSGLLFAPKSSVIHTTFTSEIPYWITLQPRVEDAWDACERTLEGHSDWVCSVAFSPDGAVIASASYDHTVRLWNTTTGVLIQTLEGHSGLVSSIAFSPDGAVVASASDDHTVRLWNATTGVLIQTLEGHSSSVGSVAFSPDGAVVASASEDNTVRLWNAVTGAPIQTLKGYSRVVNWVTFLPDGTIVASELGVFTVQLWNAVTGAPMQTLEGHSDWVSSVAFSPDGAVIASASDDHTVRLWNAITGVLIQTLEGHSSMVSSVAFSPDGVVVASASLDHTVRLWNVATGVLIQMLEGHSDGIISVAFSPDSAVVASASYDHTVRLWNTTTGVLIQTLEGHSGLVSSIAFLPNGAVVASASWDHTVRLWNAATGAPIQTLEGHSDRVSSIAFLPDSAVVASASWDHTVRLWNASTGAPLQTLEGHSSSVGSVAFSPDGAVVASASDDHTVRLWSAATGAPLQTLEGHSNGIISVTFSPDGAVVASASEDYTVRLWNAATGTLIQTLEGHSGWVRSVAFSPDGAVVASASDDHTVRLWNAATGAPIQTLEGHSREVNSVAFSPDGAIVASASKDYTVRLWNAATGICFQTTNVGTTLQNLSFSEDGSSLTTDVGTIAIASGTQPASTSPVVVDTVSPCLAKTTQSGGRRLGLGINEDRCWITQDGCNLLWLPADVRPGRSAVHGSMVALGNGSGKVTIMQFATLSRR